jgi:hypothetical protein
MTIARKLVFASVAVSLGLLSACETSGPGGPGGPGKAPSVEEGTWTDGVAVSTLTAGQFSSRVIATNEVVTTGTYTMRDQRTIDLNFFSVKSQQNTQATCLLISSSQMNCTLASGTQFSLTRRA